MDILPKAGGGENYGYGISLMHNFLANKLRLSLNTNNFFPPSIPAGREATAYRLTRRERHLHASCSLSVSYSFGKALEREKEAEASFENTDIKNNDG